MLLSALTERTLPTLSLLLRRPALLAMLASPLPSLLWMPSSLSLSLSLSLLEVKEIWLPQSIPQFLPSFGFKYRKNEKRKSLILRERESERERDGLIPGCIWRVIWRRQQRSSSPRVPDNGGGVPGVSEEALRADPPAAQVAGRRQLRVRDLRRGGEDSG